MRPAVKLITLWSGPEPPWIDRFRERADACRPLVDWELIRLHPTEWKNGQRRLTRGVLNIRAGSLAGLRCRKGRPYALCDLRPMFGELFVEKFRSYGWWGWCDFDVVFGDLNRLLPPLLESYDVISSESYVVAGPLSLLRNAPEVNGLWRSGNYADVLTDPKYRNYDEGGHRPDLGFTRVVQESGLRVRFDDRSWCEGRNMKDGIPERTCRLEGGRLYEVPTGRELLRYHFGSRVWPVR